MKTYKSGDGVVVKDGSEKYPGTIMDRSKEHPDCWVVLVEVDDNPENAQEWHCKESMFV